MPRPRHLVIWVLLLGVGGVLGWKGPSWWARLQDDRPAVRPAHLQAAWKAYEADDLTAARRHLDAAPDAPRRHEVEVLRAIVENQRAAVAELAAGQPAHPASATAWSWLLERESDPTSRRRFLDLLRRHHPGSWRAQAPDE